jgi:hypothetical protein
LRIKQAAMVGVLAIVASIAVAQPAAAAVQPAPAAIAPTSQVTLDVLTAYDSKAKNGPKRNDAVVTYKWLLNLDNTGDPHGAQSDLYCHPSSNIAKGAATPPGTLGTNYVITNQGYPEGCEWSSIRYAVASPVLSEGTQADWSPKLPLPVFDPITRRGLPNNCPTVAEPIKACRYLVSVTANGYEIGGAHFTVPMAEPGVVHVWLNPFPIPLGAARIKVFPDISPTDGTWDQTTEASICPTPTQHRLAPTEMCMAGFLATLNDYDGVVSQDFFGNPICTTYKEDPTTHKIILDAAGRPTPNKAQEPAPPDPVTGYYNPSIPGRCLSDTNGDIIIPNLAPNRYDVAVTPYECTANWNWENPGNLPTYDCSKPVKFIQTSTLEGGLDHDVWVTPDDTGLDPELVVGGEAVPWVQFGFVDPQATSYLVNPLFCATTPPAGDPTDVVPPLPAFCGKKALDNGTGEIKGKLYGAIPYVPGINGLPGVGGANGQSGMKLDRPVDRGWITVNSLDSTGADFDQRVATVAADVNGAFDVTGLRDGSYLVAVWDQPIDHAMDIFNVTIQNGQILDLGVVPLLGWFARMQGHVFIDTNGNGRQDPGEKGLFHADVQILNRTNNAMEGAGFNVAATDINGYYEFTEAYPLGLMEINQYFNTGYKTTGVTWQACNDPQEHTVIAPMVDVAFNAIIGHCGRLDWGVSPYDSSHQENGGIVATAIYDQLRLKYNARQAQTMDYQTGIPGFRVEQYSPIDCAVVKDPRCVGNEGPGGKDELSGYALNADGSYMTAEPVTPANGGKCDNTVVLAAGIPCYMTENNAAPATCFPRDANGNPIGYDPLHPNSPTSYDFMVFGGACVETGVAATQIGLGTDSAPGCNDPNCHGVQTVDGNYALPGSVGDPVLHGDVVARMVTPVDTVLGQVPVFVGAKQVGMQDRPLYASTSEQDVNFFSGAQFVPQGSDTSSLIWPPPPGPANQMPTACAIDPSCKYLENEHSTAPGPDALCAGPTFTVDINMTTNPALAANGGSPLQGSDRHTCDFKFFHSAPGQSIAPNFHFHTVVDIPLPAHWWGYIVDDVSLNGDRKSTTIGDVAGIPYVPNGFYDWTGRRVFSKDSDFNGVYEALMPSSELFNCPTPAGSCPNVYRVVGNDPGQPNAANANYNPAYRTIAAAFQAWPNMLTAVDTAPSHQVPTIEGPGAQFTYTSPCGVPDTQPVLFAVSKPYTNTGSEVLKLFGTFGLNPGQVTFKPESGGAAVVLDPTSWTDHEIDVTVGTSLTTPHTPLPAGPGQIQVRSSSLKVTTNALTFHVIGGSYTPHIVEVGPGLADVPLKPGVDKVFDPTKTYYFPNFSLTPPASNPTKMPGGFTIQDALDYSASHWQATGVPAVTALVNEGQTTSQAITSVVNSPDQQYLVVVYPNTPSAFTPLGTWYENLIIHSPLKLQGVGPGGVYPDGTDVQGSIVDGRFFTNTTPGTQQFISGTAETGVGLDNTEPILLHWEQILEATSGIVEAPPANPYPSNGNGTTLVPINAEGGVPPWTGVSEQIGEVGAGAVITVLSTKGTAADNFKSAVDGFQISGGDQGGFTGNISEVSGFNATGALAEPSNELEIGGLRWILVQGGAIYLNGGTDNFQITNNLVRQNSGSYGSIRLGTLFQLDTPASVSVDPVTGQPVHNPAVPIEGGSSHNYNTHIGNNMIAFNGGTNIGGAVAIFDDSNGYKIDNNVFCHNFSAEYGGAISHFGYSPNGLIDSNQIFLNGAFDEGGAIMVRSEPGYKLVGLDALQAAVPDPTIATNGSGPVTISHNYISGNMAQDDGGAIRLMVTTGTGLHNANGRNDSTQDGLSRIDIVNNMITNNVSAHEGGAISMDDAPVVNIINNTIAKNLTTATAISSNGCPAPAGISTGANSEGMKAILRDPRYTDPLIMPAGGWPAFSNPTIQNDILWDNRAGSWTPSGVAAIGMPGDATLINTWDIGTIDGSGLLTPTSSILSSLSTPAGVGGSSGCNGSGYIEGTNQIHTITYTPDAITGLPVDDGWVKLAGEYDLHLQILQQRTYFRFRPAAVISIDLPANAIGDYHLTTGSPAQRAGADGANVPADDIDGNARPAGFIDIGAHQLSHTRTTGPQTT